MREENELHREVFIPAIKPTRSESKSHLWFVFYDDKLLVVKKNGKYTLPDIEQIKDSGFYPVDTIFIGKIGRHTCYTARLKPNDQEPKPWETMSLRSLMGNLRENLFWVAGRANHLLNWYQSSRFCGRCGRPTYEKKDERAKICTHCGYVDYPRLSPAVIVAVVKENLILLARNKGFPDDLYSVLAGFVEPGETLEQCVQREIKEEVGLSVNNISYFGSQPWLFPSSLMVAFLAHYAGGEIVVDGSEIIAANWFSARNLPSLPPKISIARQLIDRVLFC